ncbi:hypothetical protein [Spirochaeta isovalerica]|uniref:DUF4382 domain-containing protein n=1 Tax=Spirochaeta isovalerica TaxID=150 RepID=A0A841R925_9SPIO|nr:hypothetical protein [Spirochaeta isovalerica]MBB6480403.1 hypothetical protein [Spirochaeta isovalerica]
MKIKSINLTTSIILIMALSVLILAASCDNSPSSPSSPTLTTFSIQATKPGEAVSGSSSVSSSISRVAGSPSVSITVTNKDGSDGGTLTLTKAYMAVKEIEIELEGEDDEESEYSGTYLVDLMNSTVTPDFPAIDLPDGEYDEVQMKIDRLTGTETDDSSNALAVDGDPMFGRSLYLEGTYSPLVGADQPFVLAYTSEEEIQLKDSDSVNSFAISGLSELIVAFRMDRWFDFSNPETEKNIDLTAIAGDINLLEDNGSLSVDELDLMKVIEKNIEESADFGVDSDDDGILEEDEDDD